MPSYCDPYQAGGWKIPLILIWKTSSELYIINNHDELVFVDAKASLVEAHYLRKVTIVALGNCIEL